MYWLSGKPESGASLIRFRTVVLTGEVGVSLPTPSGATPPAPEIEYKHQQHILFFTKVLLPVQDVFRAKSLLVIPHFRLEDLEDTSHELQSATASPLPYTEKICFLITESYRIFYLLGVAITLDKRQPCFPWQRNTKSVSEGRPGNPARWHEQDVFVPGYQIDSIILIVSSPIKGDYECRM
jgi:hypothetical protein